MWLPESIVARGFVIGMGATVLGAVLPEFVRAQGASPAATAPQPITFTNFRLFDGKSAALRDGMYLVVEGSRISQLGQGQPPAAGADRSVDCGGKVIMQGLIEMHWHAMLAAPPIQAILQADLGLSIWPRMRRPNVRCCVDSRRYATWVGRRLD